ncbi:MAG: hypothetical protein OSJ52_02605 [Lachnospiraceae bacterium]|nr:hypothetical protein [Lachnospiraceae bacterium]
MPFWIDYINTIKQKDCGKDKKVTAIDTEEALASIEKADSNRKVESIL